MKDLSSIFCLLFLNTTCTLFCWYFVPAHYFSLRSYPHTLAPYFPRFTTCHPKCYKILTQTRMGGVRGPFL